MHSTRGLSEKWRESDEIHQPYHAFICTTNSIFFSLLFSYCACESRKNIYKHINKFANSFGHTWINRSVWQIAHLACAIYLINIFSAMIVVWSLLERLLLLLYRWRLVLWLWAVDLLLVFNIIDFFLFVLFILIIKQFTDIHTKC